MIVQDFLRTATKQLSLAGIATARLDALILVEDALEQDRAYVLAHPERELAHLTEVELNTKIAQRLEHIPLAYIRGKFAFYGREFLVTEDVLCPRPETETMIELLTKTNFPLHGPLPVHFADIGCGSGCIGITAALEVPGAKISLFDIDGAALNVALANCHQFGIKPVTAAVSDLLDLLPDNYYDALLANLPYVPDNYPINKAAAHEPPLALFAGKDGLDLYRRFWVELAGRTPRNRPLYVFTEALPRQHAALGTLADAAGYNLVTARGFIQQFKRAA